MSTPINILIVEDLQDDADMVLAELRRAGFDPKWKRVQTEPDFLAEIKKSPDIILSDYSMPQFSGLRAAELLEKSGLDIPFILISGTVGEDVAVEAMKHGATDYLLKDRIARLGIAVGHALEQKHLRHERNRVEDARRASEARYRTLFDHAPDGIVIANPNSYYLDANASVCRMLGYKHDEFVGLHASNIVIPSEIKNIASALSTIKSRTDYHREWHFRRKDGSVFPAEVMATAMPDGNLLGMIRDITERKQFEEELNLTHEKLRQLLAHGPAVIYTLKIEGKTITPVVVSDNIERLLGFTVQESSSRDWWVRNLHPEDRERVLKTFDHALAKNGYSMDYRILHKDGTYRWVEDNNRVLRGADWKVNFMVGVWIDISGRKHAEEVLGKAARQETGRKKNRVLWDLVVILGSAIVSICVLDYTDVLIEPLEKLVLFYKGNLDDLFGPPIVLLLGFFVFACRRWRDAQSQAGEHAIIQEALRKLQGELEKRIEQRTAELTKSNNTLQKEIAERKRAEEAQSQLVNIINSSDDAIIGKTLDGTITSWNHGAEKIFGYAAQEAIGRPMLMLFPPERVAEEHDILARITRGENIENFETVRIRKDKKEIFVSTTISPVKDSLGKVVGASKIARDITERKKLEGQFRQSQKMDAIGQLASGVAHDFNNILAVIQMQSDLLKAEGGLSPAQSEFADEIGASTQRAAALTRQLLLFSRKETLQLRDLDLNGSINELTKMLRRILGDDIQLQFKFSMQPLYIHADAGMMDQVLMNLAVNSRDAMPKGGKLIIETSIAEFDEADASHSGQIRPGKFVCLSVSDTGCGIPRENLSRIFEPFFTTKEVGKGTGLGLATLFGIVQHHQGWVNVYSEVGQGTTFRIFLPRLTRMSMQNPEQPKPAVMRGGNETILLAEDDAFLHASVRKILSHLGYRVLDAVNGVEALEVWKQHHHEISLLLTDLVMPGGMNGIDLAAQLLKENPKLKVIYTSGYSAEVAGKNFPLEEGINFLTKPFQAQKLAQTVRQNLDVKN